YYICQFVLKKGKILEQQYAFKICNQAIQLLRDTEKLYYFVELLEQKIQLIRIIQKELGEKGKVRFIARFQAILKETIEWRELFLKLYKENEISPYMQHDCHIYWEQNSYAIGDIIKIRRKMFGIKREQLCEGICSERTLMRMELKQVKSQMPIVRPIFERLGLCAEYMRARVITSDIEMIQLAENLSGYINNYEMEKWEEGLNILEKKLCMKIACNKQQIIRQRSLLELEKCQISTREFIEKTIEALECTIPLESVLKNKEIYLTNEEILCIFNIGMRETSVQNQYLFVLENICNKYIQEDKIVENISIFELLMTEIASYLGNRQKYNQSDKMALQVLQRSLYCRRMNLIVNNLYNQVWNYRKRVEENLFVPHNYNEIVELKRCILLTEICQAKNKKIFLEKELENLKDN
ncbi:MAG: hypothetical protein IKJ01_08780, partial [Lachnospiraceae bacterium]|nr:hypothetical protein [Lachnospiraceae bacterium]